MTWRLTGAAIAVVFGLGCKKEPRLRPRRRSPRCSTTNKAAGQAAQEGQLAARAGTQAEQAAAAHLSQA